MRLTRRHCLAAGAATLSAPTLARTRPETPADPATSAALHRLLYDRPAGLWTEALAVGNGRIGAMVFGGTTSERLQLNEDTLWSGGPYDPVNPRARAALPRVRDLLAHGAYAEAEALANADVMAQPLHQMSYQTLGDLILTMPGIAAVTGYRRSLDLDQAVARTDFRCGGIVCTREVIASHAQQVIVMRITAKGGMLPDFQLALTSPHQSKCTAGDRGLLLTGRAGGEQGIAGALRLAARVRVRTEGGAIRPHGATITVAGARAATVIVAMATSYRGPDDVTGDPEAITARQIDAALSLPFAALRRRHVADHRRLYRAASLDLPAGPDAALPTDQRIVANEGRDDPSLAALYFHYARYLLISASRIGTQPANLQGIWNDSTTPPWGSKYTININTEMNYWPADPTGLGECFEPMLRLVRELAVSGARTARTMYGARGWVAHHNTDLWRASAPIDGATWGLWPMGGAWLCVMLWDRWDYGRDPAYLAAIYPLLRDACLFFVDTLQTSPRGLVTSPSLSPENTHPHGASICAGPAMDRQILRDLFAHTAAAATLLNRDPDLVQQFHTLRGQLAPDRIGQSGQLQEWLEDWDDAAPEPHHRHVSHLYALYPSHQIAPDITPELAQACRVSLDRRGDESTGWATAWRIALWARLRDGERAHRILCFLLGHERTYPNLFDAHPPFQIDGNFGGCAAMVEMLMQSREGLIVLLPALPTAWPAGSVRGLVARGGIQVDLHWAQNRMVSVRLVAARDQPCRISLGAADRAIALRSDRPVVLTGPELATT